MIPNNKSNLEQQERMAQERVEQSRLAKNEAKRVFQSQRKDSYNNETPKNMNSLQDSFRRYQEAENKYQYDLENLNNIKRIIDNNRKTLGESCSNILLEMATSIAGMMDAQPNPVVGQEHPSNKFSKSSKGTEKPAQYKYKYRKIKTQGMN